MKLIGIRLICMAIGYLFGMIQTSYFVGQAKGIDIRQHGSGNAGTTNTLRVLGPKAGIFVMLVDIFKCIAAVWIVRLTFGPQYPEMEYLLYLYTGAGAILGHNYPFYLGFKGGKGIAATGGMILSFHLHFLIVGLIVFFGNFFITHLVSVGSLLVYVFFLTQMIIEGQMGVFNAPQAVLNEMYIVTFLLAALAFWKHRQNIVRLIHGEERKTYLTKRIRWIKLWQK